MKLSQITELSILEASKKFRPGEMRRRIISAIEANGVQGVMDEFGCDVEQARKLMRIIDYEDWHGAYERQSEKMGDIYDGKGFVGNYDPAVGGWTPRPARTELQNIRAPQNILKILRYFGVPNRVIQKLVRLHSNKNDIVTSRKYKKGMHQSDFEEIVKEFTNNERLMSETSTTAEQNELLNNLGLKTVKLNDWTTRIYRPENEDIVLTIRKFENSMNESRKCVLHILRGMAFGYPLEHVYNYISNYYRPTVDKICGEEQYVGRKPQYD